MLSFGIEYERAFSIAFCNARLPAGSDPPSFAATMIARESFEKSCPRLASAAPFLCLIDDHLLCPDTARLLDHRQEQLVHATILGQLGMERREQEPSVAHQHRLAVERAHDLDLLAETADARRADEDPAERNRVAGEVDIRLEAPHLSSERVAVDREIGESKVLRVEHDHPGAGPEDSAREGADRLVEPVEPGEPHDRRRLAARDDEAVEARELVGKAHLDNVRAEIAKRRRVLA